MEAKRKFEAEYEFAGWANRSVKFRNRETNEIVYMHRNVANNLDNMVDYRVITVRFDSDKVSKWFEVCVWTVR